MIGKTILELSRVGSTNTYANESMPDAGFEDGTVIWAHEQFAGRGQDQRAWASEAGKNLTITVCLKPHFLAADQQFLLNKAITLGVLDFIRSFTLPVSPEPYPLSSIKWPNDLYIGDQKIGGILIENRIIGARLDTSLVGIGININQTRFAPDLPNPVSLIHLLRFETVLKEALLTLCHALNSRYEQLKQGDMVQLSEEFDQNLLGFGEWRNFIAGSGSFMGRISGVDQNGRLVLERESGAVEYFMHKEIEYDLKPGSELNHQY